MWAEGYAECRDCRHVMHRDAVGQEPERGVPDSLVRVCTRCGGRRLREYGPEGKPI